MLHAAMQVLQHNTFLQQQVQDLTLKAHSSTAAAATPAPSPSAAIQLTLLRTALTEANYRLAAAGLTPVAATTMQEAGMQVGFGESCRSAEAKSCPSLLYRKGEEACPSGCCLIMMLLLTANHQLLLLAQG